MTNPGLVASGYSAFDEYYATCYEQGQRVVYDFELPLSAIVRVLPIPDPDVKTPGNRRVDEAHARAFGKYVRSAEKWVAPALLMRTSQKFDFKPLFDSKGQNNGIGFGVVSLPRTARGLIKILDGQHRILGLELALRDIAREMDEAQRDIHGSLGKNGSDVEQAKSRLATLQAQLQRFETECLGVQIHVEDDPDVYEQMFADVAQNAKGITASVRVRFDARKVMNRTFDGAVKHSLLRGRVDEDQDRVIGTNPHLLGAKHVVQLVQAVNIGIAGRVTQKHEDELVESALVEKFHEFLSVLTDSFDVLEQVADGALSPPELRRQSLLGSVTMLRILAGVYHNLSLKHDPAIENDDIEAFFRKLAPHMSAPMAKTSPWVADKELRLLSAFKSGESAPASTTQAAKEITRIITSWFSSLPAWVNNPPVGPQEETSSRTSPSPVKRKRRGTAQGNGRGGGGKTRHTKPRRRVISGTVKDLLAAGHLAPNQELIFTWPGYDATGIVLKDGRIQVGDEAYDSPSRAGQAIRGGSVNGWAHWAIRSQEGKLLPLGDLRLKLHEPQTTKGE